MFKFLFFYCKFDIYNIILYNETKDKNLSIFGFLEKQLYRKEWMMSKLKLTENYNVDTAPSATSVNGKRIQKYIEIDKSYYKEVDILKI